MLQFLQYQMTILIAKGGRRVRPSESATVQAYRSNVDDDPCTSFSPVTVFLSARTSSGFYPGIHFRRGVCRIEAPKATSGWSVRRGFPPPQPTRGYTRSVVSSPSEIRRGPQTHFWHILRPQNASGREKNDFLTEHIHCLLERLPN